MSGSLVFERGVGTQTDTASASFRRLMSAVARILPDVTSGASDAAGTSLMCERPAFIPSTTRELRSNPITR